MDLNHRPLGYEPSDGWNFNNLQDAGGARSPCKERAETANGQVKDSRASLIRYLVEQRLMKLHRHLSEAPDRAQAHQADV